MRVSVRCLPRGGLASVAPVHDDRFRKDRQARSGIVLMGEMRKAWVVWASRLPLLVRRPK